MFYEERIADLEAQIQRLHRETKRLKEQKLGQTTHEFESCNASILNGTSFDEIKEVTLNMKLPEPVSKKAILGPHGPHG